MIIHELMFNFFEFCLLNVCMFVHVIILAQHICSICDMNGSVSCTEIFCGIQTPPGIYIYM